MSVFDEASADGPQRYDAMAAYDELQEALRVRDPVTGDAEYVPPSCSYDPESWFPAKNDNAARQKELCGMCHAQAQCLAYALAANEQHGIWGGVSVAAARRTSRGVSRGTSAD